MTRAGHAGDRAVKLFAFARGRPGVARDQLAGILGQAHASLATDPELSRLVRRAVVNVAVPSEEVPMAFSDVDAVAELWFGSLGDLLRALESDGYRALADASAPALEEDATILLAAEESVQFDRGFGEVKFMGLSRRHPSMTHEEWVRYWIDVHGPLAHGIPEFTRYYGRYVHNYVLELDHPSLNGQRDFDGIVEEWVESAEAMAQCLSEPSYLERVRPDELAFVDFERSHMVLAREEVVYDAAG